MNKVLAKFNSRLLAAHRLHFNLATNYSFTGGSNFSLSENILVGSEVVRVFATDADQDTITYSIISGDLVNT